MCDKSYATIIEKQKEKRNFGINLEVTLLYIMLLNGGKIIQIRTERSLMRLKSSKICCSFCWTKSP